MTAAIDTQQSGMSHLVSHTAGRGQPHVDLQSLGAAAEPHTGLVLDVLCALH